MMDIRLAQHIADIQAQLHDPAGNVVRIVIVLLDDDGTWLDVITYDAARGAPSRRERLPAGALPATLAAPGRHSVPLDVDGKRLGYLCFDSAAPGHFESDALAQLDAYAALVAALVAHRRRTTQAMRGAVAFTREINRHRDEATAEHVHRVAHYVRSLAEALAPETALDAEDIDFLFQFAGLHDIGKIAIPDQVLHKPGRLTVDEYRVAQSHVVRGAEMIDAMRDAFGLADELHLRMLRDVVACHHEHWDGSGYPGCLAGEAIPLAARTVAVADVFDALTNPRHYKRAWPLDEGFAYLHDEAGRLFDPRVVAAAEAQAPIWRRIHGQFVAHGASAPS